MRDNNKIPDACLQCYVHHRQRLVAHLTRLGGCRALAEDLAQDAWLKLAQVMPEQSLANPKAYLFRIATNLLRDALRHRALVGAGDEAPLELIEAVQADSLRAGGTPVCAAMRPAPARRLAATLSPGVRTGAAGRAQPGGDRRASGHFGEHRDRSAGQGAPGLERP